MYRARSRVTSRLVGTDGNQMVDAYCFLRIVSRLSGCISVLDGRDIYQG